jgi:SAM-dependent methyltransferase
MSHNTEDSTHPISLFRRGIYSQEWIKEFYTQAGKWWGPEINGLEKMRAAIIERLCGKGIKRILELGAGAGLTAALMADDGHHVIAVELSPIYANYAREHLKTPRTGILEVIEADFYTVELADRFDVVCYWDGFGVGSDADHRRLLRRIAQDWLAPGGSVLMDVFSPVKPARDANTTVLLDPLDDVPESVKMNRRCYFDPLNCRWIDEWEPVENPGKALAQTVRCYTPADFVLLLEGTNLRLKHLEIDGEALDFKSDSIVTNGPLMETYSYLVQLVADQITSD